ncbi:MAG: hypothetical protein ACYTG1_10505 [Planctomycetota bacterium]
MTRSSVPSTGEWTRCVVLAPADVEGTDRLRAALAERDWHPVEHADGYAALAELCVRERALAARAAWGVERRERLALVIASPDRHGRLDRLLAALRRHAPAVSIWIFDGTDLVPEGGAPAEETPAAPFAAPPAPAPAPIAPGAPPPLLRLAGNGGEPGPRPGMVTAADGDDDDEPAAADQPPELTPDEIGMLLEPEREGER